MSWLAAARHTQQVVRRLYFCGAGADRDVLVVLATFLALQARETGICPVREELYSQCLDELIRQVTISCAERGLLLLRVRDEMRMTTAAYQVRRVGHSRPTVHQGLPGRRCQADLCKHLCPQQRRYGLSAQQT